MRNNLIIVTSLFWVKEPTYAVDLDVQHRRTNGNKSVVVRPEPAKNLFSFQIYFFLLPKVTRIFIFGIKMSERVVNLVPKLPTTRSHKRVYYPYSAVGLRRHRKNYYDRLVFEGGRKQRRRRRSRDVEVIQMERLHLALVTGGGGIHKEGEAIT